MCVCVEAFVCTCAYVRACVRVLGGGVGGGGWAVHKQLPDTLDGLIIGGSFGTPLELRCKAEIRRCHV